MNDKYPPISTLNNATTSSAVAINESQWDFCVIPTKIHEPQAEIFSTLTEFVWYDGLNLEISESVEEGFVVISSLIGWGSLVYKQY